MNTETTETIRGWVFYDAGCAFCSGWAECAHDVLARRGCHLAPLQAGWVRALLGLQDDAPLEEMKLLTADGRILGGADAIIHIAGSIWWAWPLFLLAQMPSIKFVLRVMYRRLARNRHCLGNHCRLPVRHPDPRRHGASSFYELP